MLADVSRRTGKSGAEDVADDGVGGGSSSTGKTKKGISSMPPPKGGSGKSVCIRLIRATRARIHMITHCIRVSVDANNTGNAATGLAANIANAAFHGLAVRWRRANRRTLI